MLIEKNSIILTQLEDFDIRHILECGQIFRFEKLNEGEYVYIPKIKSAP